MILLSMWPRLLFALVATLVLDGAAQASDALIRPGRLYAVVDTDHLHVLVPAHQVQKLTPFIARAELIYQRIAHDAGYAIRGRLTLLLSDDAETHNGYSTTIPIPIINIDLASASQESFIFTGEDELERTFTHELTHHVSNDRDPNPFRHVLQEIFGRILPPGDPISLIIAYLDIPSHATMPSFWQEGCAQWAETVYAAPGSPWGGRGRDSLTHMVWRLDVASPEGMPDISDWRLTHQRWPFGTEVYIYGIAYLRYLEAAYGDRVSIWQMIERQEHRWPFMFNGGPEPLLGKDHETMIEEARAALKQEQLSQLAMIRSQRETITRRLTPREGVVNAPAWTRDGRLFAAYSPATGTPSFCYLALNPDGSGRLCSSHHRAWAMGEARALSDGTLIYTETHDSSNPWNRSTISVITPRHHTHHLPGERLLQADIRHLGDAGGDSYQVVGLHLLPGAEQEICYASVQLNDHVFGADHQQPWMVLPTQGHPWSPAFRPQSDQLCWVETDHHGSRLILASLQTPLTRTILADVPGRILHPCWTSDGARLYFCADHSGVANAYCVDPSHPGTLLPVTNTIGGILACVPKPGGGELAVVDCDNHGPYLAIIPEDPALWPKTIPTLHLVFPAPLSRNAQRWASRVVQAPPGLAPAATVPLGQASEPDPMLVAGASAVRELSDGPDLPDAAPRWSLPAGPGDTSRISTHRYHGLSEVRPLFWTPTELVVPSGGIGIIGVAADPIFTHEFVTSIGAGLVNGTPVGLASYVYGGWPLDVAVLGMRSQLGYDHIVEDTVGNFYNYAENDTTIEALTGYNLAGLLRRHQVYLGAGVTYLHALDRYTAAYQGVPLISAPALTGRDEFVAATLAYDKSSFFPTSYTWEDGDQFAVTAQYDRYPGGFHGDHVLGVGTKILTVWPAQSHQLVLGGIAGWSQGHRYLQGQYAIGGASGVGLPRGYGGHTVAIGNYVMAGSVAYRLPVYRPFMGFSDSPFVFRQVVVEGFYDTAKVSSDHIDGDGSWFRSVGGELHANVEFWTAQLNPGLGVARQLDGLKKTEAYLTLAFGW